MGWTRAGAASWRSPAAEPVSTWLPPSRSRPGGPHSEGPSPAWISQEAAGPSPQPATCRLPASPVRPGLARALPGGLAEHMTPVRSWALRVPQCPLCVDGPLAQAGTGRTGPMLVGGGGRCPVGGKGAAPSFGEPPSARVGGDCFPETRGSTRSGVTLADPGSSPVGAGRPPCAQRRRTQNSSGQASASRMRAPRGQGVSRFGAAEGWGRSQARQGRAVTLAGHGAKSQAWARRGRGGPSPYPTPHPTPGLPDIPPLTLSLGLRVPGSTRRALLPKRRARGRPPTPGPEDPQICPTMATPWPLAV